MTKRNLSITSSVAVLAVVLISVYAGNSSRGGRSSGSPGDEDYCNVLLVPSVAQAIGLDLPDRIRAAFTGANLLRSLGGGTPTTAEMASANEVTDKLGRDKVQRFGEDARAMLTPDAAEAFEELFSEGQLLHVSFWTEKNNTGVPGPDRFFLTYGWYEEEKNRAEKKTASGDEGDLRSCYEWISSKEQAREFLQHEFPEVRTAAEMWLTQNKRQSGGGQYNVGQASSPEAMRIKEEARLRHEEFERSMEESRRNQEEFRREMAERRKQQDEKWAAEARQRDEDLARRQEETRLRQEQSAEEARLRKEESDRQAEVSQRKRDAEREALSEKIRAHQEEVRKRQEAVREKIESRRRKDGK